MEGYVVDVDAFGVSAVETLSRDSGEVSTVDVFSVEAVDVSCVAGYVLLLKLVSGSSEPGDSVLDMVEVGHLFGRVHCSYICANNYRK